MTQKYQFILKADTQTASYKKIQPLEDFDNNFANTVDRKRLPVSENKGIWVNYLHDIESIWWIVIWTLFTYQKASLVRSKSKEYKKLRDDQRYTSTLLFSGFPSAQYRKDFLTDPDSFMNHIDNAPNHLRGLKAFSMTFRKILLQHYWEEENKGVDPILVTDGGLIHKEILGLLTTKLPQGSHNIDIETIQRQPAKKDEEMNPKRTTHDTRDDAGQQAKRRRYVIVAY